MPYESSIDGVPSVDNPFDPDQIRVVVEFDGPHDEHLSVEAFRDREFRRHIRDGEEELVPTDAESWQVRASLSEPGAWTWHASAITADGTTQVDEGATHCGDDVVARRGVLRVDPANPGRLAWADGTPYFALGENLAWAGSRGTRDYDRWLEQLEDHGATWIRVWMPPWGFAIEAIERDPATGAVTSSLGNYSDRLDQAWQLDYVIESALARGIVVQLVVQEHGLFSTTDNADWDNNPYNVEHGGPLANPEDVFTDAATRRLFERRLRYISSRWGWAPNVIWELWNEVDLVSHDVDAVTGWHDAMAAALDRFDPYDHLVTTSADPTDMWSPLWELPGIDIVQVHRYGRGRGPDEIDYTDGVVHDLASARGYGKPFLLAETGVDYRSPEDTLAADGELRSLTEAAWTGVFAGGAGQGMSWWWDTITEPEDAYGLLLDGLVALFDDPAVQEPDLVVSSAAAAAGGRSLQAFALTGNEGAVVWIRNPDHSWAHADLTTVDGADLVLGRLPPGRWSLTWIDPSTGHDAGDPGEIEVTSEPGDAGTTIDVPAFQGDIALRLVRQ